MTRLAPVIRLPKGGERVRQRSNHTPPAESRNHGAPRNGPSLVTLAKSVHRGRVQSPIGPGAVHRIPAARMPGSRRSGAPQFHGNARGV